jgi:hypothetical protein
MEAALDDCRRPVMPDNSRTDNLASAVRYALETTRAIVVCPFHANVTIRVGDDAAETHAYVRASRIVKSDGTTWGHEVLLDEIKRQLDEATDGTCPECAAQQNS